MNPSQNPANSGTLSGTMALVVEKVKQGLDDCLPAVVVAYDRTKNRATVQIQYIITKMDGTFEKMQQVASIPALVLGAGNCMMSFDIQPGDKGWIKANDQDISLFLQSYQAEPGNTKRCHSFDDGLFIPDVMTDYTINADDAGCAVLQTVGGDTRISIKSGRIRLTVGGATLTMTSTGITSSVPITCPDAIIDGISHKAHKHTGVQSGGSTSGGPTA